MALRALDRDVCVKLPALLEVGGGGSGKSRVTLKTNQPLDPLIAQSLYSLAYLDLILVLSEPYSQFSELS